MNTNNFTSIASAFPVSPDAPATTPTEIVGVLDFGSLSLEQQETALKLLEIRAVSCLQDALARNLGRFHREPADFLLNGHSCVMAGSPLN